LAPNVNFSRAIQKQLQLVIIALSISLSSSDSGSQFILTGAVRLNSSSHRGHILVQHQFRAVSVPDSMHLDATNISPVAIEQKLKKRRERVRNVRGRAF
jgi:hypothetical protein